MSPLQNDPDVEEVEVNLDGQWRPEGRGGRWRTIHEGPAAARATATSPVQARQNFADRNLPENEIVSTIFMKWTAVSDRKIILDCCCRIHSCGFEEVVDAMHSCPRSARPVCDADHREELASVRWILWWRIGVSRTLRLFQQANGSVAVKRDPDARPSATELSSSSSGGNESESESAELRRATAAYAATTSR
jgi:hypothetical protein